MFLKAGFCRDFRDSADRQGSGEGGLEVLTARSAPHHSHGWALAFAAQFAGTQDSLVPIDVQRRVASALESEFIEDPHGDHFFEPPFPQLISVIDANVTKALAARR